MALLQQKSDLQPVCSPKIHPAKANRLTPISLSIPLPSRPLLRPHLLHPPPARRPPQNPRPTVQTPLAPSHPQSHPLLPTPLPRSLARHTTLRSPHRLRLRALLLQLKCPEAARCGQLRRSDRKPWLVSVAQVVEFRKPDDWSDCENSSGVYNDAGYSY
jgi:hypothetical protein